MAALVLGARLKRYAEQHAWLRYMLWSVDAGAMGLFWLLMKLLGPDRAVAVGAWLMAWAGPRSAKHRHVVENLRVMFPDYDEAALQALARRSWGNLGAILADYPHLGTIADDPERLELVGDGPVRERIASEEPMIFVTPHLGNWELTAAAGARNGLTMAVVYSPQQNLLLDRLLQYLRRPLGTHFLSGKGGARSILAEMDKGHSIGMLPDQRVNRGVAMPFFGRDACTTTAPARLALSSGRALFPARVERLQGAHFRLTVYDPIEVPAEDGPGAEQRQVTAMTRQINQLFEAWIQERPEQWLCTKRRWSTGKMICNPTKRLK